MEEDEHLAQIISIHADRDLEDDDAPIHDDPEKFVGCLHRKVRLDRTARKVICRECDREVDPFTVLIKYASDWEGFVRHRTEAKRRADAAESRLQEILRLERNARARMKRHAPDEELPVRPWGEA